MGLGTVKGQMKPDKSPITQGIKSVGIIGLQYLAHLLKAATTIFTWKTCKLSRH